jgi:hypothetical protein
MRVRDRRKTVGNAPGYEHIADDRNLMIAIHINCAKMQQYPHLINYRMCHGCKSLILLNNIVIASYVARSLSWFLSSRWPSKSRGGLAFPSHPPFAAAVSLSHGLVISGTSVIPYLRSRIIFLGNFWNIVSLRRCTYALNLWNIGGAA